MQKKLRKRKKWNKGEPRFTAPDERRGYNKGFKDGYAEGLKKASLLIQLVASNSEDFEERIFQNSKEAIELKKLMTISEQEEM